MIHNKQCPKCASTEIFAQMVGGLQGPDRRPIIGSMWKGHEQFMAFVCGSCGYTEFYVPQDLLPQIKKKFNKLS